MTPRALPPNAPQPGSRLLDSVLPIAGAPMAGGPTTVALARAVAGAGGFPFLAGGYRTPQALAAEIDEMRSSGARFGVNLFVPARDRPDPSAFAAYAAELAPEAARYGLELNPVPVEDDDHWPAKIALLVQRPVPVVSLTFGLPDVSDIAALTDVGTRVLASVTSVGEARAARDVGVDGLVVQGTGAGGHSATHDPARRPAPIPLDDLVRQVIAEVGLPVVATGGVDGPDAVRRLLAAGAESVAVGTLLMLTDEAGTTPVHRAALADVSDQVGVFPETVVTRAFTGRPARALRTSFVDRHGEKAPVAYPGVHHLTRALRQAAARAGEARNVHLWAGTGYRNALTGPAADVVRRLST
ncbi:NAD(P)H-dependent flavin oxidoreductase [Kineosporia succinea]|uniref:Propionate 3-nitronate monooxygenase n=1 Tax=Kineosporia succinea TaxID=84632 RepID=A0ABT9PE33_9ACTN|nr:nitronate monooxygenase [Kineosporia succinea]MDP9830732.1 NAD(P)H-dependent flavin oxidoreductase YrpB (nitropropane dioxygenase family) [Kineosporia succinea]